MLFFYRTELLILSVILLGFLAASPAMAQDQNCQEELIRANELYTTGQFDETITLLDSCLGKEGIPDADRRTAYRLKGLSFIGKGLEVDAKSSVRRLLELVPNYQPDPVQDPPDFVMMVNEVREEINQSLANNQDPPDAESPPVVETPDGAEPQQRTVRKKQRSGPRWALIGGGVLVAGGLAFLILDPGGGGDGGTGTEIAEPPPLP